MDHEVVNGNDGELVYTLDEALSSVGFGKFQALVLVYAGLGVMAEAMELMILSFIGPAVKTEWGLSPGQESLITTMVFAGMLVGSYMWGVISDNCGRRIGLLSVAVVTSLFAVFSSFSPSYLALIIFRVLVGIGVGGGPVYSSWFLEFVPVQNRGVWMVFYSTFWTMGTILEATLAWIVIPSLGWRWLLVLSSVPCLAAFFLYFLTIESPRYLYMNGRIIEAQNILRKMASVNKMELPSGILVSDEIPEQLDEESPLLSPRNLKITKRKPGFSSLLSLLSPRLAKTTLLMWVVYFGNSFSYYGVVLLTSQTSSGQTNCSISKSLQSKLTDLAYTEMYLSQVLQRCLGSFYQDSSWKKLVAKYQWFLCMDWDSYSFFH